MKRLIFALFFTSSLSYAGFRTDYLQVSSSSTLKGDLLIKEDSTNGFLFQTPSNGVSRMYRTAGNSTGDGYIELDTALDTLTLFPPGSVDYFIVDNIFHGAYLRDLSGSDITLQFDGSGLNDGQVVWSPASGEFNLLSLPGGSNKSNSKYLCLEDGTHCPAAASSSFNFTASTATSSSAYKGNISTMVNHVSLDSAYFTETLSAGTTVFYTVKSATFTLQGNTFNGASQLLQLTASSLVPNANVDGSSETKQGEIRAGANITLTPAAGSLTIAAAAASSSLIISTGATASGYKGPISTASILAFDANTMSGALQGATTPFITLSPSSVTLQGNAFNGNNQLLQLDGAGKILDANQSAQMVQSTTTQTLQNKTIDAANNVLTHRESLWLSFANSKSTDTSFYFAYSSNPYYGQVEFHQIKSTNSNFCEYRWQAPYNFDATQLVRLESFAIRLGTGADTGTQQYYIEESTIASSAAYDTPTLRNQISLALAADASGASGDLELFTTQTTLSNWTFAANQHVVIRFERAGNAATDSSTIDSFGPLIHISYGVTE